MKNKIRKTGELYGIPNSTFCFKFANPLMTSFTDLLVKNDYVQPIKLSFISSSFIFYINFASET